MARITIEDLELILDDTNLSDTVLEAYIDSANAFVTAHLSGEGLSTALLAEIEKWIAAHMISSTRERQSKKEEAGGAKIEYTGYWTLGLNGTSYGQMAVALDTSGVLQTLAQNKLSAWTKAVPSFDD